MAERWRKPVIPIEVENHPTQVVDLPDGRTLGDMVLLLDHDDVERIRTGYVCIKCLEPFPTAWPERCPVCRFPVRREQIRAYTVEAVEYPVQIGPSTSLEEEAAGIEERRRKEEEKRRGSERLH